jgi:hypothetical protein
MLGYLVARAGALAFGRDGFDVVDLSLILVGVALAWLAALGAVGGGGCRGSDRARGVDCARLSHRSRSAACRRR